MRHNQVPLGNQPFYTYNVLDGTLLCQGEGLMVPWVHKDTLQFAMTSQAEKKCLVDIYELNPASTPPLHMLSSFSVPYHNAEFSFSLVSYHASFVTLKEVIIYNVQDSNLLLQVRIESLEQQPGQFSPDGQFFTIKLNYEIYVWQNTPTGYILWRIIRPRLPFFNFSWSSTSISILCWGYHRIQLLHPGSHFSPLPPNEIGPTPQHQQHLVAYSVNWLHIATVRKHDSIITVLDCHSGVIQQFLDTHMKIWCIRFVGSAIFAVGEGGLVSWDLEADGMTYTTHGIKREAVNHHLEYDEIHCLILSHDCSQIAFTMSNYIFVYDLKSQMVASKVVFSPTRVQFSLDGCQLWAIDDDDCYFFMELAELGDWKSIEEGLYENLRTPVSNMSEGDPEDGQLVFDHSSHGGHYESDSGWVTDSQGRKLLWLPPSWRLRKCDGSWLDSVMWDTVRWDGNFLALLTKHYPEPIIAEFHP